MEACGVWHIACFWLLCPPPRRPFIPRGASKHDTPGTVFASAHKGRRLFQQAVQWPHACVCHPGSACWRATPGRAEPPGGLRDHTAWRGVAWLHMARCSAYVCIDLVVSRAYIHVHAGTWCRWARRAAASTSRWRTSASSTWTTSSATQTTSSRCARRAAPARAQAGRALTLRVQGSQGVCRHAPIKVHRDVRMYAGMHVVRTERERRPWHAGGVHARSG